ncbi:MAG: hypothetical protein R8K47_07975, partial [Mariprofundaceae bacterium]
MRWTLALSMLLLAFPPSMAGAAEALPYVFPTRGADLHAQPEEKSPVLAHLERLTRVKILRRKKGWLRVRATDEARTG